MTHFFAALREFRRPIGMIAVGFVVLQCLLTGLAGAQAAARTGSGDAMVLCHGNPDAAPANTGAAPAHDCCAVCAVSWTAAGIAKGSPSAEPMDVASDATRSIAARDTVPIARRAIRSGLSQAPPILG